MNAGVPALVTVANHWLARFEAALRARDAVALQSLFHADSHWRDVLAFTWNLETASGRAAIEATLRRTLGAARATGFRLAPGPRPG